MENFSVLLASIPFFSTAFLKSLIRMTPVVSMALTAEKLRCMIKLRFDVDRML